MEIVLKNIHKYDSNYYKGIEISEFTEQNRYLVKFFGRDPWFSTTTVGMRTSDCLEELSSEGIIRMIVKDYLKSTKISYFRVVIKSCSIYGNIFFEANGTRYLSFNINDLGLSSLMNDVYNKYRQDRYDYCYKNDEIKVFEIDAGEFSSYELVNGKLPYDNAEEESIMKFILKSDNNGIIDIECEFIKEFIIDKVSRYNEEIQIEMVYDRALLRKGILLKCGDMKIYVPYYRYLLWILEVVDEYNKEVREANNNIKKKQLKMEGF